MKNLDQTAQDLFAKIRGRFPGVTIGDGNGNVTQEPTEARFFEFPFREGQEELGKISVSLSEDEGVVIMHSQDVIENDVSKKSWYDFLKELRVFAKKRMLNFETRDITKSNLEKRDYQYLAQRSEDSTMTESKLYGTSRVSYQDVDNARLVIKHTESVNQELATGRTQKIGKIYVESPEGERFIYPYKHLSGARAMARHVAEGGKPYDDFGQHITGLSEELNKLRKFKNYMGRSSVMAESLSEYMDVVKERIQSVKKTVESLQKPNYYKEAVEGFEKPMLEDVPEDVRENWIDQLTIKQFNEELSDVFPYIYKLVSEATKAKELGPEDLVDEGERHGNDKMYDKCWDGYKKVPGKKRGEKGSCVKEEDELEAAFESLMGQFAEGNEEDTDEGNAYAKAVRQAKMDGKKKGDKIQGPDGDEITLEKEDKLPLSEFILSYFDRESGQFPKGETAILTMVEKDYGEEFIEPAKAFIEQVGNLVAEMNGYREGTVSSVGDTNDDDDMEVGFKGNQGGKVGLSTKDDNPFAGQVGKKAPKGHQSAADKLKALKGEDETERLRKLAGL
jgi:hypothetical protein